MHEGEKRKIIRKIKAEGKKIKKNEGGLQDGERTRKKMQISYNGDNEGRKGELMILGRREWESEERGN